MNFRPLRVLTLIALAWVATSGSTFAQLWQQVPTPNPSRSRSMLRGIAATDASDVWTVGEWDTTRGGLVQPFIRNLALHWDGNAWMQAEVPDPPASNNASLWSAVSFGSRNVWAVGQWSGAGVGSRAQMVHYNGSAWRQVSVAFPDQSFLWDADALDSNDIWAVGGWVDPAVTMLLTKPYVIRYDGSRWTQLTVPYPGTYRNRFDAIDVLTPDDVWAVGTWSNSYGQFFPLVMHFDGAQWLVATLPASVTSVLAEMRDVVAVSPNDVWAVGDKTTGGTLLLHYNGQTWSEVPTSLSIGGFAKLGPNDIYGVGTTVSRFDGTQWALVDTLDGRQYPSLTATAIMPDGEIWAAGRGSDSIIPLTPLVYRSGTTAPQVRIQMSAPSIPRGGSVQLSALPNSLVGIYSYRWSPGRYLSDSTIAGPTATPPATTTYTVTMTDMSTGRQAQATVLVRVSGVTSTHMGHSAYTLSATPNPFANELKVQVLAPEAGQATLNITDALGRTIYFRNLQLTTGQNTLGLSELMPAGLYHLTITPSWGERLSLRVVRQ